MRPKFLLVLLLLFATCAFAQDQPKKTYEGKVSKFVMVSTTQLSPTKAMTYDQLVARFRKIVEEAKAPMTWIAAAPVTGKGNEIKYLMFADKYADLDAQMTAFESLGKEIMTKDPGLMTESGETEIAWHTELIQFLPKLSYNPDAVPGAQITRWMVQRYNLKPCSYARFAGLVKEVMEIYKGVPDNTAHWIAYRTVAGGKPAVLIVTPMKALADMDAENPAEEKAFTKPVMAHLDDVVRETVSSVESNIYAVRPELSLPPQSYVTDNPAFWTLKPMEPPAAPAKGKKK